MSLLSIDLAREKITEAHRQAGRNRDGGRLVLEQRMARRAQRAASRRSVPSRLFLLIPNAIPLRR